MVSSLHQGTRDYEKKGIRVLPFIIFCYVSYDELQLKVVGKKITERA